MIHFKRLILITLITVSCQSAGQLKIEGSINNSIKEASAAEVIPQSDLIWTIEDSGNDSDLFGLDSSGKIVKKVAITNASNIDWEDLTSDKEGNIYIGDFGNNNGKRKHFRILKINHNDLDNETAEAEIIDFTVPKKKYSKDFEAFFLYNNSFYLFSKETKKFITLKVPNTPGKHEAVLRSDFNLDGKNNKITSADITDDGKSVVLLNHDKVWKITDFSNDDFFSGNVEAQALDHNTQKEGICFKNDSTIYITDERNGDEGGNIYSYRLN